MPTLASLEQKSAVDEDETSAFWQEVKRFVKLILHEPLKCHYADLCSTNRKLCPNPLWSLLTPVLHCLKEHFLYVPHSNIT